MRSDEHLLYKELTYTIIGLAMNIHKELGPIHKELVYQESLAIELQQASIPFKREMRLPVRYKSSYVGVYIPDFVVDQKIIVEIKAVEYISQVMDNQLSYYLKCTGFRIGLLLNFGTRSLQVKRRIYDRIQC